MNTPINPREIQVPLTHETPRLDPECRKSHHSDRILAALRKSPELGRSLFGSENGQGQQLSPAPER
jgi:hypothetical protein